MPLRRCLPVLVATLLTGQWSVAAQPAVRGDLNLDGSIDFEDIEPFIVALEDPAKKLGPNIKLQFRNLDVYHVRALTRTSDWGHLVSEVLLFFGYHEDAINIYYAGNYRMAVRMCSA